MLVYLGLPTSVSPYQKQVSDSILFETTQESRCPITPITTFLHVSNSPSS